LLGLIKSFLSYIFVKIPANAYKTGASDKPCAKYSSQIRHTLTTFPALPKFTYSLAFFVLGGLNFTNLSSKFNGKIVLPNLPLKFTRQRRKRPKNIGRFTEAAVNFACELLLQTQAAIL